MVVKRPLRDTKHCVCAYAHTHIHLPPDSYGLHADEERERSFDVTAITGDTYHRSRQVGIYEKRLVDAS